MEDKLVLINKQKMDKMVTRLAYEILESTSSYENIVLIGIKTRGEPLANRIKATIESSEKIKIPVGTIDITFHRDDFRERLLVPQVHGTDISFSLDDKKKSMDKLTEIRSSIIDGNKSFETMARIHSMDPGSAQQGGLISASKGMMVPQFESTAFSLKPGEVSEVFETDYGFHILKLISRLGDDYTCKHILIMPEFSNDAINDAALKWTLVTIF